LELGEWKGLDVPLDERTVRATDTDDHIHRVYVRGPGEVVTLFVAYGVRMRDLLPHRPEVCYPSAGWTLLRAHTAVQGTNDGEPWEGRFLRFRQGGFEAAETTVFNYYLIDGRACPDVSLLRSKAWKTRTQTRYAAQVQMAVTRGGWSSDRDAEELILSFARVSSPEIRRLLDEAVDAASDLQRFEEEH
jgi:EpsI family protein